jgi:hypothetical protein
LILLRKAGIEAYPLCVSTHEHGRVNMVSPDPSQFNAVDVLVIDGEQLYVLDATDRLTPYFLVPQNILNTEAYMIDKEKEGWVTISDGVRKEKTVVSVSASIDAEGKMSGESVVSSFEYAKVSRIKKLSQGYKTFRDAFFEANNNDFKMDSVKISHRDNDSLHLEQKFSFERKLSNSDGYTHFGINLFAGFDKNPFLSSTRSSDIDFGVLRSTTILGSYEIPEGFEFEELPKNTAMIMPDTSIVLRRIMQADGNQLSVRINVDFKRSLYYPAEYDEFKEFYKKLFAVLNEEVVIRKKAKK